MLTSAILNEIKSEITDLVIETYREQVEHIKKSFNHLDQTLTSLNGLHTIAKVVIKALRFFENVFKTELPSSLDLLKGHLKAFKGLYGLTKLFHKVHFWVKKNDEGFYPWQDPKMSVYKKWSRVFSVASTLCSALKFADGTLFELGKVSESLGKVPVLGAIFDFPLGKIKKVFSVISNVLAAIDEQQKLVTANKVKKVADSKFEKWHQRHLNYKEYREKYSDELQKKRPLLEVETQLRRLQLENRRIQAYVVVGETHDHSSVWQRICKTVDKVKTWGLKKTSRAEKRVQTLQSLSEQLRQDLPKIKQIEVKTSTVAVSVGNKHSRANLESIADEIIETERTHEQIERKASQFIKVAKKIHRIPSGDFTDEQKQEIPSLIQSVYEASQQLEDSISLSVADEEDPQLQRLLNKQQKWDHLEQAQEQEFDEALVKRINKKMHQWQIIGEHYALVKKLHQINLAKRVATAAAAAFALIAFVAGFAGVGLLVVTLIFFALETSISVYRTIWKGKHEKALNLKSFKRLEPEQILEKAAC